jgi:hypothetical protein
MNSEQSWSLSSLLGFLNPLRLRAFNSPDESDEEANASFGTGEELPVHHDHPAHVVSARGNQVRHTHACSPPAWMLIPERIDGPGDGVKPGQYAGCFTLPFTP